MSLHAQLTPEAMARLENQRRNSALSSVIIAVLSVSLIVIILLGILIPQIDNFTPEIVTHPGSTQKEPEVEKPRPKRPIQPAPSSPSNAIAKAIAIPTVSPVAIPIPEEIVDLPSVSLGNGDSFGNGWENGWGDGIGDGDTTFGRPGGNGLTGSFYDLKQNQHGQLTQWGKFFESNPSVPQRLQHMFKPYSSLTRNKFRPSALRKYFKAETVLSFTNLVIQADTNAIEAPRAFNVEGQVQPSGWAVVYEGIIDAPEPGYYTFCGYFDDILLVYIDNKLVLDGSFSQYSSFPKKTKPGPTMRVGKPIVSGKRVKLNRAHKIKIVVAESPGGHMGGGLFIRQEGIKYRQVNGGDVLPPFTTEPLSAEDKQRMKNIKIMGGKGTFPIEVDQNVPIFKAHAR